MQNKLCFLFLFIVFSFSVKASDAPSATIRLQGGIGPSYYTGEAGVPHHLNTQTYRSGAGYSLRVMFQPEYRLLLGVETGYIPFYNYTINERLTGKVKLNAVPALLVFGLRLTNRLYVYGGTGTYFVRTSLDYAGKINSGNLSIGWMTAAQYRYPVKKNLELAGEFKWYNATETHDATLNLQLQFIWTIIKW